MLDNNGELWEKQLTKDFQKSMTDLEQNINILKEWADVQQYFPETPDYTLLKFAILYNKFDLAKAKEALDYFYSFRNMIPEYFSTTPFTKELIFQDQVWWLVPLPKVPQDHSRIICEKMNPQYSDPKYFNQDLIVLQFVHLLQYLVMADLSYKFHYILDCSGMTMAHAISFNPMALKKGSAILDKMFSNNLASFYLVNCPPVLDNTFNNILKPVLPKNLQEIMQISRNTDILDEHFPKSILPQDFGGDEKSLKELGVMRGEAYEEYRERFEKLGKMVINQELRPTKLDIDVLIGYYSNFKKMDID